MFLNINTGNNEPVSILIIGHMYSGKKYLRDRMTNRKRQISGNIFCKPSQKSIKITKLEEQIPYKFIIEVQTEYKNKALVQKIQQSDIILFTYDMHDNESMDFHTHWIEKIKCTVSHQNIALVGNNYEAFDNTQRRVSLIMEEALSSFVMGIVQDAGWRHFEVGKENEGVDKIWQFLLQVAKKKNKLSQSKTQQKKEIDIKNEKCHIF